MTRLTVLLDEDEDARFSAYCREKGFKKSTLIARLVRDHLDSLGYAAQSDMFARKKPSRRARIPAVSLQARS